MTPKSARTPPPGHVVDEALGDTGRAPWGLVFFLVLIAVLNTLDRLLPGTLAEPIRKDLGLSDTALGIINGYGFLLVYGIAAIPISKLADRGKYVSVITISLGVWSCMTALASITRTGWQFGITRVGVALGEAGASPATHAFISHSFPPHLRARAMSTWALSGPVGVMLGLIIGAYVGSELGWRATFALMGLVGIVLTPIAAIVLGKYARRAHVGGLVEQQSGRWTDLFRTRSGALIVLAASMISTGIYANVAFNPAFLMRAHGLSVAQAGIQLGLVTGLGGIPIVLAAGWIADVAARKDARWTLRILAGVMMMSVPVLVAAYLVDNAIVAVVLLGIGAAGISSYIPLTVLALYRLVPVSARARTSATLLLVNACFGGFGPLLVGMTSDALSGSLGDQGLRYAMLVVPSLALLGTLLYLMASVTYRADIARMLPKFSH
ncbi:spinster family MFS transporter [Rhizorhapis sp. SPR117]|uniref:spinster family MFS transporter n=1 Tax=Rhizorhapis sp. SPR117 TaxID=2912611 RepID=UPI001F3E12B9|nr:MFS transporter [Rhizorhapis sp. SPR117]